MRDADIIERMRTLQEKERHVGDKIQEDLFKQTTEYQYFLFGIASGWNCIYEIFDNTKDKQREIKISAILDMLNIAVEDQKSGNPYMSKYFDKNK